MDTLKESMWMRPPLAPKARIKIIKSNGCVYYYTISRNLPNGTASAWCSAQNRKRIAWPREVAL